MSDRLPEKRADQNVTSVSLSGVSIPTELVPFQIAWRAFSYHDKWPNRKINAHYATLRHEACQAETGLIRQDHLREAREWQQRLRPWYEEICGEGLLVTTSASPTTKEEWF